MHNLTNSSVEFQFIYDDKGIYWCPAWCSPEYWVVCGDRAGPRRQWPGHWTTLLLPWPRHALLQREQRGLDPLLEAGEGVGHQAVSDRVLGRARPELLYLRAGTELPGPELAGARPVDLLQELHRDGEDVLVAPGPGLRRLLGPRVVILVGLDVRVAPRGGFCPRASLVVVASPGAMWPRSSRPLIRPLIGPTSGSSQRRLSEWRESQLKVGVPGVEISAPLITRVNNILNY